MFDALIKSEAFDSARVIVVENKDGDLQGTADSICGQVLDHFASV